jgi:hypothetical protein
MITDNEFIQAFGKLKYKLKDSMGEKNYNKILYILNNFSDELIGETEYNWDAEKIKKVDFKVYENYNNTTGRSD